MERLAPPAQEIVQPSELPKEALIQASREKDPQISHTNDGTTIAKFSLATTHRRIHRKSGAREKYTEWHRITVFGRLAEICDEYLHKGKQVCIEGRIQTSSWEKDGITRYTTEIIASSMEMLSGKVLENKFNSNGEDDDVPF